MTDLASRPPLLRLLNYARPERRRIILASASSILNKIFDLAPPALIGAAVDIVVKQEDALLGQWGITNVSDQLLILALITVIVWGLESAFEYAFATLWRNLAQDLQHNLRLDAYAHVQQLGLTYFEDRSTGQMMSVLNDDINQLERFLDGGANSLLPVATSVVVVGAVFFTSAPSVAWLAITPIPLVLWGSFWFQNRIAPRYATVRQRVSELNGTLANNLSGIATIKSFTAEDFEISRVREESNRYRESNRQAIRLSAAFAPMIRMAIVIGFTTTLVYGGWLAIEGAMSVGTYSVLVFLTQRLLWPLTRLGSTFDLYQRAMASTTRVLNLLDTPIDLEDGDQPLPLADVRGEIAFQDVTFAYPNGTQVLHGLTLDIPAGSTVAIVGSTGAGKTSVIKLLLRFYDISGGRLTLDGHAIDSLHKADLRRAVGLVSQDVFLFHGTVRDNIAYGRIGEDVAYEDIVHAATLAEAHDFIMALPEGYDTVIGERGQKLSGGQRQRLSIARAVLKDPPILVLDEATSAVDNETEAAIQRSMARLASDRTVVVIAHRLSTVRHADIIYTLQSGRVVERGRHEALLDANGLYASLWRVQTGDRARELVAPASMR